TLLFFYTPRPPPRPTLFPYTTLFRSLSAPSTHVGDISPDAWKTSLDAAHAIGHEYIVVPWIPQEKRMTLDGWKQVAAEFNRAARSEEHTSELQSRFDLVCRLLLEKKK